MKEMIKKVQNLFTDLLDKDAELRQKEADLTVRISKVETASALVENRNADLTEREAKVEKVEDILAVTEKNRVESYELDQKKAEVVTSLKAVQDYENRLAVEHSNRVRTLESKNAELDKRAKALVEAEAKLAEDKKVYKQQIKDELTSRL